MEQIRKAEKQDVSRIAEILVFNNRLNFWPIFQDEGYSFGTMQVLPLANRYLTEPGLLENTFVYDDGILRGLVGLDGKEIKKLYVDPCFQGRGVGARLLRYAVEKRGAAFLWALEKNTRGVAFYQRHGFFPSGQRKLEEGTAEYLIRLEKRDLARDFD